MTDYDYDATGTKTFSEHNTATGSTVTMPIGSTLKNNTLGYTTQSSIMTMYLDNMVYEDWNISKIRIPDGLLIRSNAVTETTPIFAYNYYLKDHLGNIRVVLHDAGNGTPVIDQVSNYYPFGMEYGESAQNQAEVTYQNYLFGGKEFDRKFEVNMYDFGARGYDGTLGRWTTMDPLAEKYYSISPYAYCAGNPVNLIDPNGMVLSFSRWKSRPYMDLA
jgi:RHS repeat-associated protein